MLISCILASVLYTVSVSGHGYPLSLIVDGTKYPTSVPFNPQPDYSVEWHVQSDGPVLDPESPSMACNDGAGNNRPGPTPHGCAHGKAGDTVEYTWSKWDKSHKGPKLQYIGRCHGDCNEEDVTQITWVKIGQVGFENGRWPHRDLHDSVRIPSDLKAGYYILRVERIALHEAGKPQMYPHCYRIKLSGSGSAKPSGIKIPGDFKRSDPGFTFDIYTTPNEKYVIPGPPVYQGSGGY